MKKLGLVGHQIAYSFSQKYFESKFQKLMLKDYSYSIFDIKDITEIKSILKIPDLLGLNVTQPFKIDVMKFLDKIDSQTQQVGAINTIVLKKGITIGYNTDIFGFEKTLDLFKKNNHQTALILGNGGAAKAVEFVLNKKNIPYKIISRSGENKLNDLVDKDIKENKIIIQCTPVGTFPNVSETLEIPFNALTEEHLVIDLVYNPSITTFLKNASLYGAKTVNGFYMLEQQAEKSWKLWNE